jgi:hypothetical protein
LKETNVQLEGQKKTVFGVSTLQCMLTRIRVPATYLVGLSLGRLFGQLEKLRCPQREQQNTQVATETTNFPSFRLIVAVGFQRKEVLL